MMQTTYDVTLWKTEIYNGKRATTYYVRWIVAGKQWREPFKEEELAKGFRLELDSAMRKGEAFSIETGRPISMNRTVQEISWYKLACAFADLKWASAAATTRRTNAEALTALTVLMTDGRGGADAKLLRKALTRWAFRTPHREAADMPKDVRRALSWVEKHSRDVGTLAKPDVLRLVLDGLTVNLAGKSYAPSVVARRRKIFYSAVEYAVERKALDANPIPGLKWKPPKSSDVIDRRVVPNPTQARKLLDAVRSRGRLGRRMAAFYACLYFAAMRPEEAVALTKQNLALPENGWGEFVIDAAEPHAGKDWTDSGENRDQRPLKQRARGESRTVPCSPELTAILWAYIKEFGYGDDGRLFVGERNKNELPKGTINRVWREGRAAALTPEAYESPLARTPYDLRHAGVSTWLNGGVPSTKVAEWAGHSVEVLLRIYAKCLDGGDAVLRERMEAAWRG